MEPMSTRATEHGHFIAHRNQLYIARGAERLSRRSRAASATTDEANSDQALAVPERGIGPSCGGSQGSGHGSASQRSSGQGNTGGSGQELAARGTVRMVAVLLHGYLGLAGSP